MNKQIISKIVIRAPGFQRLVSSIYYFDIPGVSEMLKNDEMVLCLVNSYPTAHFPTTCIANIISIVNKTLKCYIEHGEKINEQFCKIFFMETRFNEKPENKITHSSEKRMKEVADLNIKFYDLSRKIKGKKIKCACQVIDVKTHKFHPESEFVEFSVEYSP
jgi:hypothetical protein